MWIRRLGNLLAGVTFLIFALTYLFILHEAYLPLGLTPITGIVDRVHCETYEIRTRTGRKIVSDAYLILEGTDARYSPMLDNYQGNCRLLDSAVSSGQRVVFYAGFPIGSSEEIHGKAAMYSLSVDGDTIYSLDDVRAQYRGLVAYSTVFFGSYLLFVVAVLLKKFRHKLANRTIAAKKTHHLMDCAKAEDFGAFSKEYLRINKNRTPDLARIDYERIRKSLN